MSQTVGSPRSCASTALLGCSPCSSRPPTRCSEILRGSSSGLETKLTKRSKLFSRAPMETPRRRLVNAGAVCSPLVPKTRKPMVRACSVWPLEALRERRRAIGVKEIFRMALLTASTVSGATPCCSLRTRDTVEADTPATAATFVKDIQPLRKWLDLLSMANQGRNFHYISEIWCNKGGKRWQG